MEFSIEFEKYYDILRNNRFTNDIGKVTEVSGLLIKGFLPGAVLGSLCEIHSFEQKTYAEVVGFTERHVLLMALQEFHGLRAGAKITVAQSQTTVRISDAILGRVVNGLGEPLDGKGAFEGGVEIPIYRAIRNPLKRKPIEASLDLGIRAMNGVLTVGRGQRVGIIAGSGVGKSVLLGMMARYTEADVNVIALIGERGREVREFIEQDLGAESMKRSVVVAVTGDQSPLLRMRGAFIATAIAEYFSKQGKNVLLMMDSVTRFAMAQREIGLAVGEPPATKGYTPSVFSQLPKLLERAGSFENEGSITGLYTVLVESDDMDDPIGDSVRSIVDGHIVLSRKLAQKGHFPSIDILQSTSRVMRNVTSSQHQQLAQKLRENMAVYREAEDLINIGAYKAGANPKIDLAVKLNDPIQDFLRQKVSDPTTMTGTLMELQKIFV